MKYKFSIGDVVVPRGCRRAYQLKNKIKIKYRKREILMEGIDEDGTPYAYWHNLYSDDGTGWYLETSIKRL